MTSLVKCGDFVKRQTPDSGFSHFEGSWEELERRTAYCMADPRHITPGYRDGVILVDVSLPYPAKQFYSAVVKLDEKIKLTTNYAPRRAGEDPFIRVSAKAEKQCTMLASVVLYRLDVLAENNERETDADWEIVAIKARISNEEEPMDPYTMARNFLHLKGGTKGDFTAEQFAQSIVYWNNHAMITGKPKWRRMINKFFKRLFFYLKEDARLHAENMTNGFGNGFL
jgi:hypothetical protein